VLNGLGDKFSLNSHSQDRIIYAQPAKWPKHLELAAASGVRKTVFDGEDELFKLAKINDLLPENKKFELLMRISTDDSKSPAPMSHKFGCPVA
jgi:diaminopimelate decarboxylase